MEDSPKTAKRREREKRTISQMVALYCAGNHAPADRTGRAHCGEPVCPACAAIDAYAVLRTECCRKMDVKTSCEECGNHCYAPEKRGGDPRRHALRRPAHAGKAPGGGREAPAGPRAPARGGSEREQLPHLDIEGVGDPPKVVQPHADAA